MGRPRLLDLFAGAGGAARGYQLAGFHVTGVDIVDQPRYAGDEFYCGDALEVLEDIGRLGEFDAVHASPPCQAYSTISRNDKTYPDLYESTRACLIATGKPWVIENVIGAPYRSGFILCGSMFGLKVRRHRNFETRDLMFPPTCDHKTQGRAVTVTGHGGGRESRHSLKPNAHDFWRYLDMPWATPYEVTQAVPPAYTEWIGGQLLSHLALGGGLR